MAMVSEGTIQDDALLVDIDLRIQPVNDPMYIPLLQTALLRGVQSGQRLQVRSGGTNPSARSEYSKAFPKHQLPLLVGQMLNEMFAINTVDGSISEWKAGCCIKEQNSGKTAGPVRVEPSRQYVRTCPELQLTHFMGFEVSIHHQWTYRPVDCLLTLSGAEQDSQCNHE
jgi:hypothetical protein